MYLNYRGLFRKGARSGPCILCFPVRDNEAVPTCGFRETSQAANHRSGLSEMSRGTEQCSRRGLGVCAG